MRKLCFILLFLILSVSMMADNSHLLDQLDAAIENRAQYIQSKESNIAFLKKKLKSETDNIIVLKTIDDLYKEYYVYKFDSAMAYADKGIQLAIKQKNDYYQALFTIHRAEILVFGGLYNEAINTLDSLHLKDADNKMLFKYYSTYFSAYSYYSDYCSEKEYAPLYRAKANGYFGQAMQYISPQDPLYDYYKGEQRVYVDPDSKQARQHYHNIIEKGDKDSRAYAMAAYALAGNYQMDGDSEKYEKYLILAALSDLKCCTMENMALQSLAVYLFQKGEKYIERAEKYISISMEDAKFYNNRLRILEISRIMPQIMSNYQTVIKKQNTILRYSIIFISFLVLGLLCTAALIHKQNRKLTNGRMKLANTNQQLTVLNQQLAESNQNQVVLNNQLKELNGKLVDTNKHREGLVSIYIDLCAKYIDKLGKFQTLVKRKIKANQAQELLQTISSARISEEDAATFLNRFDKAFLELYPTFIEEFNVLLNEDARIQPKTPNTLTTELRTFALIRLGVKNTSDIAGLLFLSPQTIYNCRSVIKNKALKKDSFDNDIQHLCTVIDHF